MVCPLLTKKKEKVSCFKECPFNSKEEACPFLIIKDRLEDIEEYSNIEYLEEELKKELGILY